MFAYVVAKLQYISKFNNCTENYSSIGMLSLKIFSSTIIHVNLFLNTVFMFTYSKRQLKVMKNNIWYFYVFSKIQLKRFHLAQSKF